jgi:hypothetical protein
MQINAIYLLTLSSRIGIACSSGLDSPTTLGVMIMIRSELDFTMHAIAFAALTFKALLAIIVLGGM